MSGAGRDVGKLVARLQQEREKKLGPHAGLRIAGALEHVLHGGPRGQFFVIPHLEWHAFSAIIAHLAERRRVVRVDALLLGHQEMDAALQLADAKGQWLVIDARKGMTEGALKAVTRYFGQIEHTMADFNEEFGVVLTLTEDSFLSMSASERDGLVQNCHYRGYYPDSLAKEGPVKELLGKPAGPGVGRANKPAASAAAAAKPRVAAVIRRPTDPAAAEAQDKTAIAAGEYAQAFWSGLAAAVRRRASPPASPGVPPLQVPVDVAELLRSRGANVSHLAQKLTQEIRALHEGLPEGSYSEEQIARALERSYRLIVERARTELRAPRASRAQSVSMGPRAAPNPGAQGAPDDLAREACAAVYGCDAGELHLLEFDDDRGVSCRAMFPRSALGSCAGIRKQLEVIRARRPQAKEHNVLQFCNDFAVLFSASDAASLWSAFALPYAVAYWPADRRILDFRRVKRFGLP